jgi:hypothetical protein
MTQIQQRADQERQAQRHQVNLSGIALRGGTLERERAILEENYRFEVELARQKGQDVQLVEEEFSNRRRLLRQNESQQITDASLSGAQNLLGALSGLNQAEQAQVQRRARERIELVDEQERRQVISKRQAAKQKEAIEKETEARVRRMAERGKQLARAEAIINIAQGVTKAFAQGGVLGFITGASVVAAGAVQLAKIEAQEFEDGGFPTLGGQAGTLIRVNEGGRQEAVLNAAAVSRIGRENIDRANRGGSFVDSRRETTNHLTYSPQVAVYVQGNNAQDVVRQLEAQAPAFFRFIEQAQRRGYKLASV